MKTHPKKVLLFTRDSSVPPVSGASGVYSWGITRGFSSRGYKVILVSKMFFKRFIPFSKVNNILIFRSIPYPYLLRKYLWAVELLIFYKLFNPNLVFIRLPEMNFVKDLKYIDKCVNMIKVPVLSKINFVPSRWAKNVENVLIHSTYIVCETKGHKNWLNPSFKDKAIVMPNGIDLSLFDYQRTRASPQNQECIVLLGTIDKYRNTVEIVRAFGESKIDKKIKMKIIGDGPDREKLINAIADLHIEDRVILMGKIPHWEIPAAIKDSLLGVVLPHEDSIEYTSPLKLLEFMSMGVPVLTTSKLEDTKEINQNCLIMINDFSKTAVLEAFESLTDKFPEDISKICANEAKKYSWENMVSRLLSKLGDDYSE